MYVGIGPEKDTVVTDAYMGHQMTKKNLKKCWWNGFTPGVG